MKKNILIKIASILTILMITMPTLSYADTIDKIKNPLEYKAMKEIEEEERKEEYLEIALNIIENHLGTTRSDLVLQSSNLSSLYEYIDNAYKLNLTNHEFESNIIENLSETEEEESPQHTSKNLFKYFLIIFFIAVAITSAWNYILFKLRQIKANNMRK